MNWGKIFIASAFPLFISSCIGSFDSTRTTELDKYSASSIKEKLIIGSSTKRDTLILLGMPNSPEDYNNSNEWTYKSDKTDRRIYFFIPFNNDKTQELRLEFNEKGVLSSLDYTDKAPKHFKSFIKI